MISHIRLAKNPMDSTTFDQVVTCFFPASSAQLGRTPSWRKKRFLHLDPYTTSHTGRSRCSEVSEWNGVTTCIWFFKPQVTRDPKMIFQGTPGPRCAKTSKTLRDGELTLFRNHLVPFGRPRFKILYRNSVEIRSRTPDVLSFVAFWWAGNKKEICMYTNLLLLNAN